MKPYPVQALDEALTGQRKTQLAKATEHRWHPKEARLGLKAEGFGVCTGFGVWILNQA